MKLERRYRLLLSFYPKRFREQHEASMLATLLDGAAPEQHWPKPREALSLVRHAALQHYAEDTGFSLSATLAQGIVWGLCLWIPLLALTYVNDFVRLGQGQTSWRNVVSFGLLGTLCVGLVAFSRLWLSKRGLAGLVVSVGLLLLLANLRSPVLMLASYYFGIALLLFLFSLSLAFSRATPTPRTATFLLLGSAVFLGILIALRWSVGYFLIASLFPVFCLLVPLAALLLLFVDPRGTVAIYVSFMHIGLMQAGNLAWRGHGLASARVLFVFTLVGFVVARAIGAVKKRLS